VIVPWGGDFSAFDAAVIRGPWDYVYDRSAFLDWAESVPCPLHNPVDVLRWNTDKRYLRDLAGAGVPVVPTSWSDEPGWSLPEGEFVVKPAVSAGARWSARYKGREDWKRAEAHIERLASAGGVAMIQPFVPTVETVGESGTYVFGGEVSHAIRKGSILAPGAEPEDLPAFASVDYVTAAPVDPALATFALAAVAASPGPLLYARVDTVASPDGTPWLIEFEAAEPYLFLDRSPGAADRFVQAWLALRT
jgi:glutathione synthase/RimK-type ligase-like ATP-grasp enzyme